MHLSEANDTFRSFPHHEDPEIAWLPAKLKRSSGNVADVQIPEYADEQSTICDGGKKAKNWIEAEVDLSDYNKGVLPMQNVDENGNLRKFADMVELPFLHEVCRRQPSGLWWTFVDVHISF